MIICKRGKVTPVTPVALVTPVTPVTPVTLAMDRQTKTMSMPY